MTEPAQHPWWSDAVFYQIYPRSFADLSGDGVGDLPGVTDRLGYLELLGVDAIWLSPVMRSPMADHGYDVSDPRDIDPLFGGMAAFDALLAEAHRSGIKVVMDLVPNHTSHEHHWFTEALAAAAGGPARDRYIFRDGKGDNGDQPPNNWRSIFGGPAWTRITEPDGAAGQWYLHLFAPEQPDLNWDNPEVWADLEKTMRFWLDRGIDGFRIDVAHGMAKPNGLPDMPSKPDGSAVELLTGDDNDIRFNNPGVHRIHRKIRGVLNDYPEALAIGEIWVRDSAEFAQYVRPDELHLGFNFALAEAPWSAAKIRAAIDDSLGAVESVRAIPTWTLSNHDVDREVTRLSKGVELPVGTLRARAMILVELALPGASFIYNGAELGLPNVDLPDAALQDPVWERSGHTERGRDACRVPLPWGGEAPPYGFSTNPSTWLPMPDGWRSLTTEAQLEDAGSMLSLYRSAIELRKTRSEFTGDQIDWYGSADDALAFRRDGGLVCVVNAGIEPIGLPPGQLLLASTPLTTDGLLSPNAAAWLTRQGPAL